MTKNEIEKLATAIARDYVNQELPLEEGTLKVAKKLELNANQVQRLSEATNNAAFNELFQQREKQGSEDRLVTFPTVDAKKVLSRMDTDSLSTTDARANTKVSHVTLPDLRHGTQEKVASDTGPQHWQIPATDDFRKHAAVQAKREREISREKVAAMIDVLITDRTRAELAYEDCLTKLAKYWRRTDALPFAQFEKAAAKTHGSICEGPLNTLRTRLGMPEVTVNVKVASDSFFQNSEPERLFKTAVAEYATMRAARHAIQDLETKL